ncbi:carbohydrate binding domain-containing protein [Roseateles sp. BYS180W]|uniref:Carbohydrate binding domain-containing protein n=1 Tax=Roseateles rivi TaxID=3299028 RepID=A0ABW7FV10_9BURK
MTSIRTHLAGTLVGLGICGIGLPVALAQSAGQGQVSVYANDLITDSGFESGALTAYKNSAYAVISTDAYSGGRSAKLARSGGWASVSQPVTGLVPGAAYTAVVMAKTSDAAMPLYFTSSQSPNGPDDTITMASNSWRTMSVDFTASFANEGKSYVYCSVYGTATGAGYCDDMHVYRVTPLPVADSGFETGTLNLWTYSAGAEIDSSIKHSGNYAAKIRSGALGWVSAGMAVKPRTSYIATAWLRTGGTATVALEASLTQSSGWISSPALASPKAGEWFKQTITFTTGDSDDNLHLYCGNSQLGGDVWCDDFQLRELVPNHQSGSASVQSAALTLKAGHLSLGVDASGTVVNLVDQRSKLNYVAPGKTAPLISLVIDGKRVAPSSVARHATDPEVWVFSNAEYDYVVHVRVHEKTGYAKLTLEYYRASRGDVQTVLWGPLASTIKGRVGDAVGHVQEGNFTLGLKPLNAKTEAGWPSDQTDVVGFADIVHPIFLQTYHAWAYQAAQETTWGSVLRAFTVDYTKPRTRTVFWPQYPEWGPPSTRQIPLDVDNANGDILYSTIALYGADSDSVMTTLSTIAKNEGLPYLTLNGQWHKVASGRSDSHLVFFDLGQSTMDTAVRVAKDMGLSRVYSLNGASGPWQSNGSYEFNSQFGSSDSAAATIIAGANAQGVSVGMHTLSNFIDNHDPLVTSSPPSPDLAIGPRASLTRPLNASSTTLYVTDNNLLDPNFRGKRLRVGNELLDVTGSTLKLGNEIQISGVTRGAFGSTAASHAANTQVSRLLVNEYGGFSGQLALNESIGRRIANLYNQAKVGYHSFDGLEEAGATGYGARGFAYHVNRGFVGNLASKDGVLTEASQLNTGIWDAITRISWGEVGKTSPEQRVRNRLFYTANLMPNMLGWISFDRNLTLPTLEQVQAEAAGADAGIGYQTWVANVGDSSWSNWPVFFAAVKEWEAARHSNAFSPWQKAEFLDLNKFWKLSKITSGSQWKLRQIQANGTAAGAEVTVSAPAAMVSNSPLPSAKVGAFYQTTLRANTPLISAWAVSAGSLPPGLSLNKDTGGLMGTPSTAGSYSFTVTATLPNATTQPTRNLTLVVQ